MRVRIDISPEVQARLIAKGISDADVFYAFRNYTYKAPVPRVRGDYKIIAPLGKGRLFIFFQQQGDETFLVREAYWNPRK